MDCPFCKIANGDIPADICYEDDKVVAFADLNPQAPIHKLIIPRQHISSLNDLTSADNALMGHLIHSAQQLADQLGIATDGYRLLLNCNAGGGQTVFHLHVHLLGGRQMRWPPG